MYYVLCAHILCVLRDVICGDVTYVRGGHLHILHLVDTRGDEAERLSRPTTYRL